MEAGIFEFLGATGPRLVGLSLGWSRTLLSRRQKQQFGNDFLNFFVVLLFDRFVFFRVGAEEGHGRKSKQRLLGVREMIFQNFSYLYFEVAGTTIEVFVEL